MTMWRSYTFWGLLLIVVMGGWLRLWGINHQVYTDENKVTTPSIQLALGSNEPLLYPKGARYPHLYHYVLAAAFLPARMMGAESSSATIQVDAYTSIARTVTALIGTATIIMVFFLGKELGGVRVGMIAALLFAAIPLHVKYSHYVHVDLPLTFMTTLTLYAALRVWQKGTWKLYALTGALIGLSAATHYTGVIIGIVLLVAHAARLVQGKVFTIRTVLSRPFLVALALIPLGFALGSPFTLIDWRQSLNVYQGLQKRGEAGDLGYTSPNALWTLTTDSPDWGLAFTRGGFIWEVYPALFVVAVIGIVLAFTKRDWKMAVLVGAVAIFLYVVIASQLPLYAVKRLLPITPLVALLAAYTLDWVWKQRVGVESSRLVFPGVVLLILLVITFHNVRDGAGFAAAYAGGSTHSQAVLWAQEHVPEGSVVLQHTPLRLLDWDDKRFTLVRLDEVYANFNKDDPEVGHDRAKPIQTWTAEKNVDFIAMDSRLVDRYYDTTSMRLYPETTASYRDFYNDIRKRGKLVYKVEPLVWKAAGPRVEIYDVRGLK